MNNALNGTRRALRLGTGIVTCVTGMIAAQAAMGQALPVLDSAGGATVSTVGNTLTVDATAANRVINWNSFSVDAGNTVKFVSTTGGVTNIDPVTVVNRVVGNGTSYAPSYINGSLNSSNGGNNNIKVWLVNPAGITFGPTGAFSGGSLVLSTLDFVGSDNGSSAFNPPASGFTRLQRRDVTIDLKLDVDGQPLNAMELKLTPSNSVANGFFRSAGSVLLLGEQIVTGKSIEVHGDIDVIAASDVQFQPLPGSPLSFRITKGTTLSGTTVLASGSLSGRNIVLAASNGTNTVNTLLKVESGSRLTATANNGAITLSISSVPLVPGDPVAVADIDSAGSLLATAPGSTISVTGNGDVTASGLRASGDITVRAGSAAANSLTLGAVSAGGNFVGSAGGPITLGTANAQSITAGGSVSISNSVAGDIALGAGVTDLTVRSDREAATGGGLSIDSRGAIALGNARLDGGLGNSAPVTLRARDGSIEFGTSSASKFTAAATTGFKSNGAVRANNSGIGAGVAASISTTSGTLELGGPLLVTGVDQDADLRSGGSVVIRQNATVSRNISIGAAFGGPVPQSVTALSTSATTPALSAGTGQIRVFGGDILVQSARAGTDIFLNGTTVTVGGVAALGNYQVNATGDIVLGTAENQRQSAAGFVLIDSTEGSVRIGQNGGTNYTGLIVTSNSDGAGTETLSINAKAAAGDIDLGTATLNGGSLRQSRVTLNAGDDIRFGSATGSAVFATAGDSFTSTGSVLAGNDVVGAGNSVAIVAGSGGVAANAIEALGPNHDVTITTPGAVTAATIRAVRNVTVNGPAAGAAASLTATTVTATAGSIDVKAGQTAITGLTSGLDTTINSLTTPVDFAGAAVGNAIVGRDFVIRTAGDITLGTAPNQTARAVGGLTLISTAGSIKQGATATNLTVTANSDGAGTGPLTLNANKAITLGSATLNGGPAQQSAIVLTSGTSTLIDKANSADFTATAGTTFTATGNVLAAGNAAITAGGAVALKTLDATGPNHDVTITTPGAVTAATIRAARNVTVKGPGAGAAASLTATTAVTATAGTISVRAGATDIAMATSGLDTRITGTTAKLGTVTAGRDYVVSTTGNIILGTADSQQQKAKGAITLTSSGGNITDGSAGLTLTSNSDGIGTEALTVNANKVIALTGTTLKGGADQQSAVNLTSGLHTTIKGATSADFSADVGGNFFAAAPILAKGNAVIAAGGSVAVTSLVTTGADHDITISAPGPVSAITLDAARNVTVLGGATSFTATTVTADAGNIDITAGTSDIGTATSELDTKITGTMATLGKVTAGHDYIVSTTGDIVLGKAANQLQQAGGAITLTSSGGNIRQGEAANNLTVTANSDGGGTGPLTLNANKAITLGSATLNGGPAQQSAIVLTSGTSTLIDKANSADFTATSGTTFTATGNVLAAGNAAITAGGAVSLTTLDATGTDHDVTITTPGAVTAATIRSARNVTVGGGTTSLTATTVTAGTGTIAVAAGMTDIGTAASGIDTTVTGGSATLGKVTAGRDYVVSTTGDITLGKAANQVQQAGGLVTLTSSAGSIKQGEGATGLTLASNSDGAGGEALTLNASGAIALGTTTLNGGTAENRSAIALTSGVATAIGRASGADFTASAGGSFTAADTILAVGNAAITAEGAITLDELEASGTGHDIVLTSPAAISATSLTAARNVTVAGLAGSAASLTAGTVSALAGSIDVKAGATDIGAANSLLDTKVAGNTAVLGTVISGRDYSVTATGNVTLGKAANQTQQAKGLVTLTSTGGSISQGATGLTLTSNSDGVGSEDLTLNAGQGIALGSATLNGGAAQQSAVRMTSGTDTTVGRSNGLSLVATAGGSFTATGAIASKSTATLTATNAVRLNGGGTVTDALTIKGSDATIGNIVTAKTIDVVNSGSGKLVIGDFSGPARSGFVLNRAEIANLQASDTLTLGAGSVAARDVEIGTVNFTTPKTVRVLAAAKRIDVTGRIVFGAATKTLKLGGDVAAGTGFASIIQVSTTQGGSISGPDGVLELGAANILVGQDAFATDLGAALGGATGDVGKATRLNVLSTSSLYNPQPTADQIAIEAASMKINFTGFAMFQNLGSDLLAQGVKLGTGSPTAIALDIASTSSQPVFALFGSVNGVVNSATALLGNPPFAHFTNVSSARVNGCVIGGGNCQSVQNVTPAISGLENVRNAIFFVKPDFQVPFDPLVGTNNDALFDDVGSFGLGDVPMTPIECSEPNGNCDTQKKDAK